MEKKRWVLIFSALCLALVFSVSSVEAQKPECVDLIDGITHDWSQIQEPERCDKDGDCFLKRNRFCQRLNDDPMIPIDCDDNDYDPFNNCRGDGGGGSGSGGLPEFVVDLVKEG